MLFSIIVPVYNMEKWLNGCVDSILGQSFGDFELILVDDGSTDRSGEICDSYAARDGRVRVIHRPNGGPSQARNEGLAVMKGDYVIFVDSDDRVETNLLEEVRATLLKKPVDVVVWGYNAVSRAGTKRHLYDPNLSLKDVKVKCLRGEWPNALWIKCWKRELFDGVNFPDEVLSGEDMWVTCSLIMKAKSASVIHKSLYNYRLDNPSSISNNLNSRKYYWAMRALLRGLELGGGGNLLKQKITMGYQIMLSPPYWPTGGTGCCHPNSTTKSRRASSA